MTTTPTTSTTLRIPGPRSRQIDASRAAHVSRSVSSLLPVYIESAQGSVLTDVDGNEFIDLTSGIGVIQFGHHESAAIEAMLAQTQRFTHTLFTVAPYELYVEVCRRLNMITPGDFEKKSVLSSTGAEAIENAMKIARAHTRRNGIAVVEHGYHGRTNLTLGLNYKASPYADFAGPRPGEIYRAPTSHPYRDGLTGEQAAHRAIAHLSKVTHPENLAALLIEPIQGEGGIVVPDEGYLIALQQWAREHGIVVVADEIQTGLGRTGKIFASEHFGFVPDLVVTAKAIGAGIPLSAVTGRSEIVDTMAPGALSGTFSGNPVACAAALTVFDRLQEPDTLAHTAALGERLLTGLRELQQQFPVIGDVRGLGALIGIELITETGAPNPDAFGRVHKAAMERGVLALGGGSEGHVMRLLPAIDMPLTLADEVLQILRQALADQE